MTIITSTALDTLTPSEADRLSAPETVVSVRLFMASLRSGDHFVPCCQPR